MAYNHTQNYFFYKGKCYGIGTVVKFKEKAKVTSQREANRCNRIAKFVGGLTNGYLKFSGIIPAGTGYCGIGIFDSPEDNIEEIVTPVYHEFKPTWQVALDNYRKTPKNCRADIAPGTIIYIAVMLTGTIFNARLGIWIVATILYLRYLVNIYRD